MFALAGAHPDHFAFVRARTDCDDRFFVYFHLERISVCAGLNVGNVVTLPVALSGYFGAQSSFWGEASALSLIATLPIIIVTLLVQRHLVAGLTLGAIK